VVTSRETIAAAAAVGVAAVAAAGAGAATVVVGVVEFFCSPPSAHRAPCAPITATPPTNVTAINNNRRRSKPLSARRSHAWRVPRQAWLRL
jgi:hypothetical protein